VGGDGSSRWAADHYERKTTVEECYLLDVRKLKGALAELPETSSGSLWAVRMSSEQFRRVRFAVDPSGGAYGDPLVELRYDVGEGRGSEEEGQGDPIARAIDVFLNKDALSRKVTLPVELASTSPGFGGTRWFFCCPLVREEGWPCGKRVAKLWLPEAQRNFGCRECHGLAYGSDNTRHVLDKMVKRMMAGAPEGANRQIVEYGLRASLSAMRAEARRQREHARSPLEKLRDFREALFPEEGS
jgi:hypothetical protein